MLNLKTPESSVEDVLEKMVVVSELLIERVNFKIPPELEAKEPPEARGLRRDEVRLMVSNHNTDSIQHTQFRDFPDFLSSGDVVVINTSGTLNAAVNAKRANGSGLEVWTVELRKVEGLGTAPFYDAASGEMLRLPDNASLSILAPHQGGPQSRLWLARLSTLKQTASRSNTTMYRRPGRQSIIKRFTPQIRAVQRCPSPDAASHLRSSPALFQKESR
jgi:hypothetical protein